MGAFQDESDLVLALRELLVNGCDGNKQGAALQACPVPPSVCLSPWHNDQQHPFDFQKRAGSGGKAQCHFRNEECDLLPAIEHMLSVRCCVKCFILTA